MQENPRPAGPQNPAHHAPAARPQVLAKAIGKGTAEPVNDYLRMTNKKKVLVRDINPKSVSTQELYGFVNMATREWKASGAARAQGRAWCVRAACGLPHG
jgi:hypothetical protein